MPAVQLRPEDKHEAALRLLRRKNGATVELIAEKLKLANEKAARGIIDRLRAKDVKIKNIGQHTFKVNARRNPARSS